MSYGFHNRAMPRLNARLNVGHVAMPHGVCCDAVSFCFQWRIVHNMRVAAGVAIWVSQLFRCAILDLEAIHLRGHSTGSEFLDVAVDSNALFRGFINHASSPTISNNYSVGSSLLRSVV